MKLSRFAQRRRTLRDTDTSLDTIDALEQAIGNDTDLPGLLKLRTTTLKVLSPQTIVSCWRANQALVAHKAHLQSVATRRRTEGLSQIPWGLLHLTSDAQEVSILEKADALAPAGRRAAEHRRRDAIKEALMVYTACLAIARRDARLRVELTADDEELLEQFGALTGTTTLGAIDIERWLKIRAAEADFAVELMVDLPIEAMEAQVEARRVALGPLANNLDASTVLKNLILKDLSEAALTDKDREVTERLLERGGAAYLQLLSTPRPKTAILAGVHVLPGGDRLAVAIVQRDGRLLDQGVVPVGDDAIAAVEKVFGEHAVEGVAWTAPDDEGEAEAAVRAQLRGGFAALERFEILHAALDAGVAEMQEEIDADAAAAVVVARRAVRPLKYWGQVDPLVLALPEYPESIEDDVLRSVLQDMRTAAAAGVRISDLDTPHQLPPQMRSAGPRVPPKPLNPLVKNVHDLRPGMEVEGIVTNIANFGAFVNIGLSHEGLIHISELAEHYVKDPNEVVKVNQQIKARVLGVDPSRGRISLSLKPDRLSMPVPAPRMEAPSREGAAPGQPKQRVRLDDIPGRGRPRGGGFRPGGDAPHKPATGANRDRALADLEALFKKND
ncbi:MAG: S1 RNA-binding domain-containing protein [Bradymonadia bacterium]